MSAILTLPRLGETMESGRVVGWLKQPGQSFARGETLVEIESDKTVVELPALASGTLLEILAAEGADIEVGAPLCRYEGAETQASDAKAAPLAETPKPVSVVAPAPTAALREPAAPIARPRATPVARRVARQMGVDIATIIGTGRRGRIGRADVEALGGDIALPASGEHELALDSGTLAYRAWVPAGPQRGTAVLLHGFAGDSQTWAGLASVLSRTGMVCIAPDLPAHGATTIEAAAIDALVTAAVATMDRLGLRDVELVGHSLGGAVAARVARAAPARVARLTLIAPAGLDSAIDADFVAAMAQGPQPGALAHLLRRLALRPPALSAAPLSALASVLAQRRLTELAASVVADGRQQVDIVADLRALSMPVRIVWGLQDRIIPWTQAAQAGSRVALHLIADAGHMPHWDRPDEVAALFDQA